MVVSPCPGRGIKEIAIADRCTINWPTTIIRGASSCVPRRQADTKDTRYLYDADAINFARNNVQFRHLINRGRTAIVGPAAFRAAGSPLDVCSVGGRGATCGWISVWRSCGVRPGVSLDMANTMSDACQWEYAIYRTKNRCTPKNYKYGRRGKLLPPGYFRRKLSKFRSLAAVRCSHINLYTLVFVYWKHFALS